MAISRANDPLAVCKLEMSPSKTKIVYCKDGKRRENYPDISFDFLGYTFRPRKAKARDGSVFLSFLPAISGKAAKALRQTVRQWNLQRRTPISLEEIARRINPILRGWVEYYGRFRRSALYAVLCMSGKVRALSGPRRHQSTRGRMGSGRSYEYTRTYLAQVDLHVAKWIARKHKRVRRSLTRAYEWLRRIRRDCPSLFAHWCLAQAR